MKKPISHSVLFLLIIVLLVSLSIAFAHPQDPPPVENVDQELEVGSTTGITVLAFIISGIILLPLLTSGAFKRKKKTPQE